MINNEQEIFKIRRQKDLTNNTIFFFSYIYLKTEPNITVHQRRKEKKNRKEKDALKYI
jgi:hypothetical protein